MATEGGCSKLTWESQGFHSPGQYRARSGARSRISITSMSKSKNTCTTKRLRASLRHLPFTIHFLKLGWWNGRHVRLRGVCRKACGFKSRPEHQIARSTCSFAGQLFDLAFIAYGFCSLFQEITSHRGKKRFASQIPKLHKEPPDSVLTISKIGH